MFQSWYECIVEEDGMLPLRGIEPRTVQPVAYSLYRLRYPGSHFVVVTALNWKLRVFQSWSERVVEEDSVLPLRGFEPRTLQPVAYSVYRLRYSGSHSVTITAD